MHPFVQLKSQTATYILKTKIFIKKWFTAQGFSPSHQFLHNTTLSMSIDNIIGDLGQIRHKSCHSKVVQPRKQVSLSIKLSIGLKLAKWKRQDLFYCQWKDTSHSKCPLHSKQLKTWFHTFSSESACGTTVLLTKLVVTVMFTPATERKIDGLSPFWITPSTFRVRLVSLRTNTGSPALLGCGEIASCKESFNIFN